MSRNDDQGLLILNEHGGGRSTRPKDLIQAISEIEQFSVAEMNSEIPEGSLPIKTALSFGDVGVRSGLFSGLMTAVTTPLMMAAGQKLIPIFGEYEPSLFNQVFSIALAIAFPICFGIFLFMSLTKSFAGNITRRAIDYLAGGVALGTGAKTILFIILFHHVCFQTFVNGVFVVIMLMALVIGRYRTWVRKKFLREWE
jgi:hypothetical protein